MTAIDVLLVGAFHMASPGHDLINLEVDDVRTPHRQKELEELAANIARFEPTRICVEVEVAKQAPLDVLYDKYRAGSDTDRRDELHQVAFRVAHLCALERVDAIDDLTPMDWDGLDAYLELNPAEAARFEEQTRVQQAEAKEESKRLLNSTIGQFLRELNKDEALRADLAFYIDLLNLKGEGATAIADLAASWYERNIRIFGNLARATGPGDRAFVLFGAGHVPILRHLIETSSTHELVNVGDYLP